MAARKSKTWIARQPKRREAPSADALERVCFSDEWPMTLRVIAHSLERIADRLEMLTPPPAPSTQQAPAAAHPAPSPTQPAPQPPPKQEAPAATLAHAKTAAALGNYFIEKRAELFPSVAPPDQERVADEAVQYALMGVPLDVGREVIRLVMERGHANGKGPPADLRFCRPSMERAAAQIALNRVQTPDARGPL